MKRLHPSFHKELRPSREFTERARGVFLAAFRGAYGARAYRSFRPMQYLMRAATAGLVLAVMFGGSILYADAANVGPTSILYPLKRSGEIVKLAFAREEEKPTLHLKLAERRLEELEELHMQPDVVVKENKLIAALATDFKKEVASSFSDVAIEADANVSRGQGVESKEQPVPPAPITLVPPKDIPYTPSSAAPSVGVSDAPKSTEGERKLGVPHDAASTSSEASSVSAMPRATSSPRDAEEKMSVLREEENAPRVSGASRAQEEFCRQFNKVVQRISPEMRDQLFEEKGVQKRAEKKCGGSSSLRSGSQEAEARESGVDSRKREEE